MQRIFRISSTAQKPELMETVVKTAMAVATVATVVLLGVVVGATCSSCTMTTDPGPDAMPQGSCGNLVVDPYEDCDTGAVATSGCDIDCTIPLCGDGVLNPAASEVCDDGNVLDGDGCNRFCTSLEICGNGVLDYAVGEECDSRGESATCDADCSEVVCGDGTINHTAGEHCDDGNSIPNDGCTGCLADATMT